MKTSIHSNVIRVAIALMLAAVFSIQFAGAQTTNYFVFGSTTINSGAGPSNPSSGATTISGASLTAGETIVFDGIVANTAQTTGDNWGAVELNAGGYLGITSAQLGVLVRTGTGANTCALYYGGAGANNSFAGTSEVFSNRVRIELYISTTGSTTNLGYFAEIDQGVTGTWTSSLSGTNLTFTGNAITLKFGANAANELFFQEPLPFFVTAPSPASITVATNQTATFSVAVSSGFNTIQCWRKNGVFIPGATSLNYTTPPVVATDNGAQYDIVVTNALNTSMIITGTPPATLTVHSTPGYVPFNFPTTTTTAGFGTVTDPNVSINGNTLLAGDIVVFDGIVVPNGTEPSDAWTAINIAGSGYGNVTSAKLGVLDRQGSGPSQLFINGSGSTNPTPGGAATNRVRIELYPSANGSTTNMGWLVEIDQNLTGTFLPAVTGTNLTFANNTLPLTFGSSGGSAVVYQNPQSPVSIFSGPGSFQTVAAGSPVTVGVTVMGWSPAFQWYKNNQAIANATSQSYTQPSTTLSDNGDRFFVVVSNKLNSLNVVTSSVANVAVLIPGNFTWYPTADGTTWDTNTPNWTLNGGVSEVDYTNGNNVTLDSLGYNYGGNYVTLTNTVYPTAVTFNTAGFVQYVLTGAGSVSGQSLLLTGDNTGDLVLQTTAAFSSAIITNATLQMGYLAVDGAIQASYITNYGSIVFNDAGLETVSGVITGPGTIVQNGSGTTSLTATNSAYTIGSINNGILSIASTPNAGIITNNSEIQPNSSAATLAIPNAVTGTGHYAFTGFQTTLLTGLSTFTGQNRLPWSHVIVDNPQALGDTNAGYTAVTGADNIGGLYLSNNIDWSQPLELDPRLNAGSEATAPHIANWSGTNIITSPLTFASGQGGSEINVEATAGLLTISAASTLVNTANNGDTANDLNLQGSATGIWNGILLDSTMPLNVVKRGTGAWTLGGVNTYSGTTTVSGGTLLINGQIGTNNVAVQSGGTLGGNGGTIGGSVSVASGGTIAPGGTGNGSLTINNTLNLAPGSFTSLNINKTAASNDQILGVTALTYGGTLVVNNLSGTLTTSDSFKLFTAAGYSGAFTAISPASPGAGLAWNTSTLTTDGTLRIMTGVVNPIPLTATVVGGNTLQLNWGTNGWTLQVQTNNLNKGVSGNTNDWTTYSGGYATTNTASIPIVKTNINEYYRLVH
jgi:autotransporter-associated beta strand protein